MDAGSRAKRVATEHRIVQRNSPAASLGGFVAILAQARQVVFNPAQQLQVHQQLIHGCVADALAHAQRRAVNLICAAFDCRERIDHTQSAVLMSVPVQAHLLALLVDYSAHKLNYFARTIGRGVADRVADADGPGTAANRGGVERANRFRISARRIFGHEYDRQAFTYGKGHRLFRHLQKFVDGPFFRIEPDQRRTDEGAGFDGYARTMRNFHYLYYIVCMSPSCTVWPD